MTILQINSHYNKGGAARIVACIHSKLLENGQKSYVAYGRGGQPEEKNIYRFNTAPEIYFSAFISRFTGVNGWANRIATKRLISYIKKIQPDIIHLHTLHGYYLNFAMLFHYINRKNIPCVWTFHDCHAFVGNCGYFFECRRWETGCGQCPNIKVYPSSQFFDFTHFMWKRKKELFTQGSRKVIVSPSQWLTEEAKHSFFGKYPCITIRNGIDAKNTFYPRGRETCRKKYGYGSGDRLVLGIAASYSYPQKGAKYIIRMAKDLEAEVTVILIGWEKKNNAMLEGTKNIITLPATADVDMLAEYYSMADVFVMSSLSENYATVSLESMACGTPVVGFQSGGVPEQLVGGKGIAVKAGDQKAFTEAVRKAFASDNGLLHGEELAALIRQENSTEKMIEEYLKVYRGLTEESK